MDPRLVRTRHHALLLYLGALAEDGILDPIAGRDSSEPQVQKYLIQQMSADIEVALKTLEDEFDVKGM